MFDELFPKERATSLSQSVQRPYQAPEAPGTFSGVGGAIADAFPHAAYTAGSAWAAVLDAYGKAAAYRDAPTVAMIHGQPMPDMDKLKLETIDQMGNSEVARQFRERAQDYLPDPASVGMAGQITHGVLSSLTKAGAYAVAGGPAAPVLFGADLGINRAQELSDKGVDGGTAALAGAVTGVTSAVGMRLPAAMGSTRLQSAAIGAAVNPALNVVEIGGIHTLLEAADYEGIAAQYQPFDPVNLAVAAVTGAAFGAAFHRGKPDTAPRLTPDEHAAALTMHEARVRDADALVRPGDIEAANAAREAQITARNQLDAGEPVSVAHRVPADPEQIAGVYRRVADGPVKEVLAEGMPNKAPEVGPLAPEVPLQAVQQADTVPKPATNPVERLVETVTRMFSPDEAAQPASQGRKADTPEQARAFEIAARDPDAVVRNEEGVDIRVAELLNAADDMEVRARTDSAAFDAAIECALRFPQ